MVADVCLRAKKGLLFWLSRHIYHICLFTGWRVIMAFHFSAEFDVSCGGRPCFCLKHFGIWKRQKNSYSLSSLIDWEPDCIDLWPQQQTCTILVCSPFFNRWLVNLLLFYLTRFKVYSHVSGSVKLYVAAALLWADIIMLTEWANNENITVNMLIILV